MGKHINTTLEEHLNESINLTDGEKTFLWNKMEVKKKAKAKEQETDVYKYLNTSLSIPSEEEFIKILNTLEYSMKKRVKEGNAPKGKYEDAFNSLIKKLPSSWVGVKFSSLKAKDTRDNKKPTEKSLKSDIVKYLKKKNISHDENKTKKELLDLIKQ